MAKRSKFSAIYGVWVVLGLAALGVAGQVRSTAQFKVVQMAPAPPPSSTIVRFETQQEKQQFLDQHHLRSSDLKPIPQLNAYVAPIKPAEVNKTERLASHPNLQYQALLTPNDPIYPDQWWLGKVSAPSAWDITTGSSNVTIAVIDTGFALSHQDLSGRWAENAGEKGLTLLGSSCWTGVPQDKATNNCDDDGNGFNDDWRGWDFSHSDNNPNAGTTNPNSQYASHGTLTAGLAGAGSNNGMGVAGVDWGAKILPIQALDDDGIGYTDTVAAAIYYAADRGVKVISLSLGSSSPDTYMRAAIGYAISKGAVVVAAAGNTDCNCMVYPANFPEVIAVGASDQNDGRSYFSSYGTNLDIMAPGNGSIRTTYWTAGNTTSAYTSTAAGTSISTPIVAGAAALIFSRLPSATPDDIARILVRGADKVSGLGGQERNDLYGYGRLNTYKALLGASLSTSRGQLLNKTSVSLSSASLSTGPQMNSTCYAAAGAVCDIKLTGPDNSVGWLGSRVLDEWGGVGYYWNAQDMGLSIGRWKIEAVITKDGQSLTTPAEFFDINT